MLGVPTCPGVGGGRKALDGDRTPGVFYPFCGGREVVPGLTVRGGLILEWEQGDVLCVSNDDININP